MDALVFSRPGEVAVRDWPQPRAGQGEVVLRVVAAGLCGTDRHIADGSYAASSPVVLGHEVAGIVEEIGAGVVSLRPGDRVSVDPNRSCGVCLFCHSGRPHLCERLESYGVTRDGGLAPYMAVQEAQCHRVPDGLETGAGILAEPLSCVVHALDRVRVWSGMSAAVWGLGTAGILMIQCLRALGATSVIGVSPYPDHREKALRVGATAVFDAASLEDGPLEGAAPAGGALRAEGLEVDLAVEASGSIRAFAPALRALRKGGQLLVYGVADPGAAAAIHPEALFRREISIVGSFVGPLTMDRALSLLAAGTVDPSEVLGDEVSLRDAADWAMRVGQARRAKVHVRF